MGNNLNLLIIRMYKYLYIFCNIRESDIKLNILDGGDVIYQVKLVTIEIFVISRLK